VLKIASQSRQDLAKALCVTIQHESLPEVKMLCVLVTKVDGEHQPQGNNGSG
jgi:hypothetical protein